MEIGKGVRLIFRVSREQDETLEWLSDKTLYPKSVLINMALKEYLDKAVKEVR